MQNKAVGTGLKLADDMPTGHPSRGPSCFGSGALDSSSCHQGSPALRQHGDKLPCLHTSHKPLRVPRPQKHNGLVITRPPLCIQGKPQPLSTHPELVASFSISVAEKKEKLYLRNKTNVQQIIYLRKLSGVKPSVAQSH